MMKGKKNIGKWKTSNKEKEEKQRKAERQRYRTSGSAIAEGPRDVLVSRNSATTKYRYRVALFA